jgi:flagellar protein FlgJ
MDALDAVVAPAPKLALNARPDATMEKLRAVALEFEGMVLGQLLAPMFEALPTDGLGGGGPGEAMFRPMLVQRYADSMARAGGIGLADHVLGELVRLQAPPAEDQDGAHR